MKRYAERVTDWNLEDRSQFENLDIFVGIPTVFNAGNLKAGPFLTRQEELHEFQMTIKDSYGQDGDFPEYNPLFYSISDISVTQDGKGLGFGPLEDYQTIPVASFEFQLDKNDQAGDQSSKLTVIDLPLLHKKIHYHIAQQETCLGTHGFFDIEEKTCTTVHKLAKVCVKVEMNEDQWEI